MDALHQDGAAGLRAPIADELSALAAEAFVLEPPAPHERKGVLRSEAAELIDRLLVRVARGRGALDVALGEGLAWLAIGDRGLRLGFSGIGDYARERLGIAGRTALAMARLARELRDRPRLAEAVRLGEVSARKAQVVLAVARGEAEAEWVARARQETVRALQAAVRDACAGAGDLAEPEEERWESVSLPLASGGRARLDEAMALAGKLLGATAPRWQRLEAICQEYLGSHPDPIEGPAGRRGEVLLHGPIAEWLEGAKEALEEETEGWSFLTDWPGTVAAPGLSIQGDDPSQVDAELRQLAGMRDRWDEILGHLAMLLSMLGLWRDMKFASFGHYCAERLGMAERTVAQRAALSRRLYALPELRRAMQEGRLSYEKARLVARCADDETVAGWIERARRTTCVALRREIEAEADAQMCAREEFDVRVPQPVAGLLDAAVRAARAAADRWLTPGECLERIAAHFVETWREALAEKSTRQRKVLVRDGRYCQVPGCSRAAVHAHHIVPRAAGGADDLHNLVALCAAHHLHGIHAGYVHVRGHAPDRLRWELGISRKPH